VILLGPTQFDCSGTECQDKVLTQSVPRFTVAQPPYKKNTLTYPQKQQQCPQPNKKALPEKSPTITQHIPGQKKPVYFTPQ